MKKKVTWKHNLKRVIALVMLAVVMASTALVGKVEAAEVTDEFMQAGWDAYQNFLDASEIIKTDSAYETCRNQYDMITRIVQKDNYLQCVEGATQESLDAMNWYEVLVYTETYLKFAGMVIAKNDVSKNSYIYDGEDGVRRFADNFIDWLEDGKDSEKAISSYEIFVNWQVEYYRMNGYPFNFITGKSFAEETGMVIETEAAETVAEEMDVADAELAEILSELTDEELNEIKEEVKNEMKAEAEAENKPVESAQVVVMEQEVAQTDSVEESSNPAIWIVVVVAAVAAIGFIATKTLRTNKVTDKK